MMYDIYYIHDVWYDICWYVNIYIYTYMWYVIYYRIHSYSIYSHPKKKRLREINCTRFRYRLLPAAGFGTARQHRIVGNHVLFLLGQKKKRCLKKNTPRKINMEHFLMEVWFRSFSFLFMGDGCRFHVKLPGCNAEENLEVLSWWWIWQVDEVCWEKMIWLWEWCQWHDIMTIWIGSWCGKVGCMLCKLLTVSSLCSTWFLRWLWKFGDRKHVLLKMLNPLSDDDGLSQEIAKHGKHAKHNDKSR